MTATGILCHCEICNSPFPFNKHKANRVCSMACYRALQRSGEYKRGHGPDFPRLPCANCGVEVERIPSKCRDGSAADKVFCNRGCYDAMRTGLRALRLKPCQNCGIQFVQDGDAKFCSDVCSKAAKKAKPVNCVNCECLFTAIYLQPRTNKYISKNGVKTCSATCDRAWISNNEDRKRKIGDAFRGDKHPNWQGGKSQLNNTSNRGPNWAKKRIEALKRDGFKCVDCGMSNEECLTKWARGLDVDHVVPFHNFNNYKKANALGNLESRCASCHRTKEAARGMVQMMLPIQDGDHRRHKGGARTGENHPRAKLSSADVILIRRIADDGKSLTEIGASFGMAPSVISSIVAGRIWKCLPLGRTSGESRLGRNGGLAGEDCGKSRFTEIQVMDIRSRANSGERLQLIANSICESYASVHQIVTGKTWKHLPILGYVKKTRDRIKKWP